MPHHLVKHRPPLLQRNIARSSLQPFVVLALENIAKTQNSVYLLCCFDCYRSSSNEEFSSWGTAFGE